MFQEVGTVHLRLVRDPQAHLAAVPPLTGHPAPQRVRIADAATRCVARTGIAKTTLDDVATEAGCSRATIYRTFPGGKEEVIAAVTETGIARLFSSVAMEMGGADDLENAIVNGFVTAARAIRDHEALQYVLAYEPGVLLPYMCFEPLGGVLAAASGFVAPFLARWLDPDSSRRVADFASRVLLSHLATPVPGVDLADEQCARRLVSMFVMPGAERLADTPAVRGPAG